MSRTPDQIAADRARYEEHQRKGLQNAPRALPGPSAVPAPPIADPLHVETIPGGWYWSTGLKAGDTIRIAQDHGPSAVSMIAWSAGDTSERLNLPDTVKVQWTTALAKGRVEFIVDGQPWNVREKWNESFPPGAAFFLAPLAAART